MNPFPDRTHFSVALSHIPEAVIEVWEMLTAFLNNADSLPEIFEVSQIAGHVESDRSTEILKLKPREVGALIKTRRLTGFSVEAGNSSRRVWYFLRHYNEGSRHAVLSCKIEKNAKAPDDWSGFIASLLSGYSGIGAWQWRHLYQVWQWTAEVIPTYEFRFGPLPLGYQRSEKTVTTSLTPQPPRVFIDICKNPGRPKELLPMVSFYPTAEMWLGPHFWQYAKCTKEEALAADFFIEKRDTPNFLYLKCWPTPFTRPDGEQGRMQQRLWKLFFHEDCEWPPGSGTICDEPMYGPPELMPGYPPPAEQTKP